MTEFFHWISVNPMATVFVGLIAVVFVVLCVAGFLQGREITFWWCRSVMSNFQRKNRRNFMMERTKDAGVHVPARL